MTARLAVVGDLVEDVVVWPEGAAQRGTDVAARIFRTRGGSAANVAVAAAAHVPTRFLGCVGADPLGDRLLGALSAAGVEAQVQRRGRTGTVVVLVDADGERTFLTDRAAAAELAPLPGSALDEVALLHVPAYGLQGGRTAVSVRSLLDLAGRRGVPVSVDASSWAVLRSLGDARSLLDQLRPVLLFANADEARELDLAARPLSGVTVVLKDGARSTRVLAADGRTHEFPVAPVAGVRDSTGAGDAFAAGWLTATMEGRDLAACAERAHALARDVLTSPGAGARTEEQELR